MLLQWGRLREWTQTLSQSPESGLETFVVFFETSLSNHRTTNDEKNSSVVNLKRFFKKYFRSKVLDH